MYKKLKIMKMKNVIKNVGFLVLLSGLIMVSCKKDNTDTVAPNCSINKNNLAGSYKITAVKYKPTASSLEVDFLNLTDACERDNVIVLRADGTYALKDIGEVCMPDENEEGTWQLNGNLLTSNNDQLEGIISSYDCKKLVFYITDVKEQGDRIIFEYTKL